MAGEVKRAYRSARRREQAEETRRRFLSAARTLFVAEGYGRTTIDAIASSRVERLSRMLELMLLKERT